MNGPQLTLFQIDDRPPLPASMGPAAVRGIESRQILTPARGLLSAYDYSLNPYAGCTFGCGSYCYARFFIADEARRDTWGSWVDVKENAVDLLRGKRNLLGRRVYMSSATDPYQPVERKVRLTRRLLECMSEEGRQPRLVVQTRSPLVVRDIDLLQRFRHLRVNLSVTTDSEDVRKRFELTSPGIGARLRAIRALKEAGIRVGVCVSPMLPILDAEGFGRTLAELGADVYVTDYFHQSSGSLFAKSTGAAARALADEYAWDERRYWQTHAILKGFLPGLHEGVAGFMPE